jgi:hypothetical protein
MAKVNDDIDALFKLPLTEFINARKTLAARLKKNAYADEAQSVTALAKPSVSAWTVNQLYWNHRDEFDELISTGQRFRKAQASGKMVNMREALDARREALAQLSDLATEILGDGRSQSVARCAAPHYDYAGGAVISRIIFRRDDSGATDSGR